MYISADMATGQAIQSPASATVGRVATWEGLWARCIEEPQRIWREVARGGARQPRTKLAVAGHSFSGQTLPRQPRQSLAKRGRTCIQELPKCTDPGYAQIGKSHEDFLGKAQLWEARLSHGSLPTSRVASSPTCIRPGAHNLCRHPEIYHPILVTAGGQWELSGRQRRGSCEWQRKVAPAERCRLQSQGVMEWVRIKCGAIHTGENSEETGGGRGWW
ncbi:hypothetical protein B0H14DRAFT_3158310 [Mycena olivaceomarginata]|nr:hypothetical protein B0H14DRAFT_3158310 [Mycena olivaceomarginata]